MRRILLAALAAVLVCAPPAAARILAAEDVLPPGQSGFVSTAGLKDGTGSPHLYDQQSLFTSFRYKPFGFQDAGGGESPRPGVRITRDAKGVPAVHGATDADAWFGAGYAVAQDRLFELELFRRATTGRLAEILGKDYLADDIVARRDYYTGPELDRQIAKLPARLRARFDAYRDGINAWIAHVRTDPRDMPGEFAAVGDLPIRDWTVRDSAAVGVFLARTVPSGDGGELTNLKRLRTVGAKNFRRLIPLEVRGQRTTIPRREGVFRQGPRRSLRQLNAAFQRSRKFVRSLRMPSASSASLAAAKASVAPGLVGRVGGSSMFAIRDRARKRAFLFNGPQLGFAVPELFVELEVAGPGYRVRGVTAPGVPLVAIGHNARVAWGFTSGLSDEDDLYAERASGETYRFRGTTRAMSCRDETFTYRPPPSSLLRAKPKAKAALSLPAITLPGGLPPVKLPGAGGLPTTPAGPAGSKTVRVCRTRHGPVQSRAGGTAYARRYAIWNREIETLEGLSSLAGARSVKDVDRAMLHVTWNENLMAADSSGNIGYWHPGLFQVRPPGWDERLPYPGTGEAEWRGLLPRRRDPHVINPRQGWLANWNNVPAVGRTTGDAESPERLGGTFHRVHLLQDVVARVAKRPSFARVKNVIRITGTTSQARPIARGRLRAALRGARSRKAKAVLRGLLAWNGNYTQARSNGTVAPGVAMWEEFKDQGERYALVRLGDKRAVFAGEPGTSHVFDTTYGEAFALRTLSAARYRVVAVRTFNELLRRFGTSDTRRWREQRRVYAVQAQGGGQPPRLPFFDRGTWEQFVAVGR